MIGTGHGYFGRLDLSSGLRPWRLNSLVGFVLAAVNLYYYYRPQRSKIYPLNLSISLSGGKESNSDSFSNGEWTRKSQPWIVSGECLSRVVGQASIGEQQHSPKSPGMGCPKRVRAPYGEWTVCHHAHGRQESLSLGVLSKSAGVPLLRLNIARRPIANKYSDGKMQRTLKRELKVPETDEW